MKCQICQNNKIEIKEYKKNFIVKGKNIEENIKSRFCSNCNNMIYDEVLDEEALKKVYRKYSILYGIEPDKIINLRKEYKISQELFSKIIGCAKKTLISYEKGTSIPNDTYMIIIKTLIENKDVIKPIIESNKEKFDKKEYSFIENNIYSKIKNNEKNELSINNGYTNISLEKIKNVISYLSKEGIHKTKLLKELFYSDFKCYKEYGYSLTGMEYAAIKYGPVPNNYELILNELVKDNTIEFEKHINQNYEETIIKTFKKNIYKNLNNNEIELLDNIKKYFKNYSVKEIVDFSHEEKAFKETKQGKLISYEYSFDLKI